MYFDQDTLGNTCVGSKYFLQFDKDGNYLVDSLIFKRVYDESQSLRIDNEFIFRGMSESVTRNNFKYKQNYDKKYNTFIRKVNITGDSVIFNGTNYKYNQHNQYIATIEQPEELVFEIGYNYNSLVLNFTATYFEYETNTQFSYKLEGFDKQWSEWSNKTEKEYTNLPEGKYTFQVKAKNIYGAESSVAMYSFKILPPWYRTIFAYIIYVILAIFFIFVLIKLFTIRLERQKQKLEQTVVKRTAEIMQQKEEIQTQNEEIQIQNENLYQQKEEIQAQSEELLVTNQELEKLSIVASETDNAIVIMDSEGSFEWGNDGFSKLYGYTFYEFIEKYPNMISASSNPEIKQTIKNCIKDKKPVIYESVTEAKSGEKIWVQTTLTPILDISGNINKIIAIDSDIRKLKEIESELELKNEHITGSIRYAKTIQTGILPFGKMIDKHFENFILFRPKDIVSGDFYWFAEVEAENKNLTGLEDLSGLGAVTFIAAVDCTGHGVPGAFMSMIGSSLLNQIVYNENEYDTADILTKLNELVIFSLRQEKTDNNDGMDVCLCRIEKQETSAIIQFTGAKRPLFYMQNGASKIEKLKGDRKSIGGTQVKKNLIDFSVQEIELENGSTIYLSSDGFVDQNNPSRKKFGTSKLISILESISQKDLKIQHEILNSKIETWMNGTEQRDDITLLGIKL